MPDMLPKQENPLPVSNGTRIQASDAAFMRRTQAGRMAREQPARQSPDARCRHTGRDAAMRGLPGDGARERHAPSNGHSGTVPVGDM